MRTGLFLSREDGIISSIVDVDLLAREFSHLPAVKVYDSFFRYNDQQDILKTVDENGLEAIVFAGNSPKYFDRVLAGGLIIEALKSHGIDENKIAFANIKEQVALAHSGENGTATEKAHLLINVALAKALGTGDRYEPGRDYRLNGIAGKRTQGVSGGKGAGCSGGDHGSS